MHNHCIWFDSVQCLSQLLHCVARKWSHQYLFVLLSGACMPVCIAIRKFELNIPILKYDLHGCFILCSQYYGLYGASIFVVAVYVSYALFLK